MALDINNPWEVVAYFALAFYCEECSVSMDFHSSHEPCSDKWCVELAKTAFERGWFVRHPNADGSMDLVTTWCPNCGKKLQLTQPAYKTFAKQKTE